MQQFVNKYFSLILVISCGLGFLTPDAGSLTPVLIPILLATVIFSSFFQISFSRNSFDKASLLASLYFYLTRYLLLPTAVYFAIRPFSEFYAAAFFLMVLLPSAVSSPTFSLIFNGNITMSVFLVVFTNILTPLCIPLMCHYVLAGTQEFDGVRMFQSLFYTVFLPLVLHLPFRKSRSFSRLVVKHNSLITVVSLAFIFILAVARYKTDLISHISLIPQYIGISFLVFFFLYFVGWFMGGRTTIANKITFSISSGANNIGLGVTLTILYFSAEVNVYFITAQFTWTLILVILRPFLRSMIGFFSPKTPRAVVGSKP